MPPDASSKPLAILDLDGTCGLFHLWRDLGRKIYLRPELAKGLEALAEWDLAVATRAEEPYLRAVTRFLETHGIRFHASFSRADVALDSTSPWAAYYKCYDRILERFSVSDPERVVVVGDLMNLRGIPVFRPDEYRRTSFTGDPSLLCTGFSLTDHPLDRRMVYVVVPQVLTKDRRGQARSLSMVAVARALKSLLDRGEGSFLAGLGIRRFLDPPDEFLSSGLLAQRIATDIGGGGLPVRLPWGTRCADRFLPPFDPHHYLVLKGRARDWKPLDEVDGEIVP